MNQVAGTGDARLEARLALGDAWFRWGVTGCVLAVGAFLSTRLLAWPPHEDETLALFVGRQPLAELLEIVLHERGGAPLHYLVAAVAAHSGGGLAALRLASAAFALASIPLVATLVQRLAGRAVALAATVLVSASWILLFHGIYGRMYSLFLFTSAPYGWLAMQATAAMPHRPNRATPPRSRAHSSARYESALVNRKRLYMRP